MTGWFYVDDGQTQGPIPEQQIRDLFSERRLGPDTLLWTEGMTQWQKASETALFTAPPPPVAPPPQAAPAAPSPLYHAPAADVSTSPGPADAPRADAPITQTAIAPTGEGLQIGQVLRQSFSILWARLGFWLLTGLFSFFVLLPFAMSFQSDVLNLVTTVFVQVQLVAMVTYGAFQICCGRHFTAGEAFQKGAERYLPILGTLVLMVLVLILVLILGSVPAYLLALLLSSVLGSAASVAIVYGAALVFQIVVFLRMFVSTTVCVAEKAGPIVSIKRSFQLTKGSSWKIFGLMLIVAMPLILLIAIAAALISVAIGATGLSHGSSAAFAVILLVAILIGIPFQWLFNAFMIILSTTTYAALRQGREGVAESDIAEVFE